MRTPEGAANELPGWISAPPWDEDEGGWHYSDDKEWEAWKGEGMADAEDWNPDSWRDGWPPTPEEELLRKELEQGEDVI